MTGGAGDFEEGSVAERKMRFLYALRSRGVTDIRVLTAMERIDRGLFVRGVFADRAYEDMPLPIACGQTISQPSIVGLMTQALNVQPRDKVLEVGTGCGYQAAVLARVFGEVFSVERIRGLHEAARANLRPLRLPNLRLAYGDGFQGLPDQGPFDAIILAAAGDAVPEPLLLQMSIGGRLIAPVLSGPGRQQVLHWVERPGADDWRLHVLDAVRFVPLQRGTS